MAKKTASENDCNSVSSASSENPSRPGFQRFYQIFDASPHGLLLVNHQGDIVESNRRAQDWFQYSKSELMALPIEQLVPERFRVEHRNLRQVYNVHPESHHMGERRRVFARRRDGSEFPVDITLTPLELEGEPLVLATVLDASIYRASLESMERLAYSDPLTGLPNRRLFYQRLDALIESGLRKQVSFAVMLVDLDYFKEVNDTLGHAAGDLLLIEVAGRMQARIRDLDTLARLGGDEFGIIVLGVDKAPQAASVAEKLLSGFGEPLQLEGQQVSTSASLGISLCPQDGSNTADIVRCADTAMYAAKHAGRNQFLFYKDVQNDA